MTDPDLPPNEQPKTKLSLMAQTYELIKAGGAKIFKLPEPIPTDWPYDVKERWYPLFMLMKSPYFTELDIGRLIEFKARLGERVKVGLV